MRFFHPQNQNLSLDIFSRHVIIKEKGYIMLKDEFINAWTYLGNDYNRGLEVWHALFDTDNPSWTYKGKLMTSDDIKNFITLVDSIRECKADIENSKEAWDNDIEERKKVYKKVNHAIKVNRDILNSEQITEKQFNEILDLYLDGYLYKKYEINKDKLNKLQNLDKQIEKAEKKLARTESARAKIKEKCAKELDSYKEKVESLNTLGLKLETINALLVSPDRKRVVKEEYEKRVKRLKDEFKELEWRLGLFYWDKNKLHDSYKYIQKCEDAAEQKKKELRKLRSKCIEIANKQTSKEKELENLAKEITKQEGKLHQVLSKARAIDIETISDDESILYYGRRLTKAIILNGFLKLKEERKELDKYREKLDDRELSLDTREDNLVEAAEDRIQAKIKELDKQIKMVENQKQKMIDITSNISTIAKVNTVYSHDYKVKSHDLDIWETKLNVLSKSLSDRENTYMKDRAELDERISDFNEGRIKELDKREKEIYKAELRYNKYKKEHLLDDLTHIRETNDKMMQLVNELQSALVFLARTRGIRVENSEQVKEFIKQYKLIASPVKEVKGQEGSGYVPKMNAETLSDSVLDIYYSLYGREIDDTVLGDLALLKKEKKIDKFIERINAEI